MAFKMRGFPMVGDKKKKHPIVGGGNEEFNKLSKQLNDQFKKGIISAQELATKKNELLNRLTDKYQKTK